MPKVKANLSVKSLGDIMMYQTFSERRKRPPSAELRAAVENCLLGRYENNFDAIIILFVEGIFLKTQSVRH